MSSSSRFVRASSYRHVFADNPKTDDCYQNLNLSTTTGDHNYIKGNDKFFSVAARGGGGPVYVIPYTQTGKLPAGYPVVAGHSGAVYDTDWHPFNSNILATGSDDQTIKFWEIPDGGLTEKLTVPLQTLSGHGKPVTLLHFHPTANNVIASASKDQTVRIWDVESGEAKITLDGFEGLVQDFDWNFDGSMVATSSKDKQLRVWDPRSQTVTATIAPHEGAKAFKLAWLGSSNNLVTAGFTRQSKRELRFFDSRSMAEPLLVQEIDTASGVLMPFYDEDTKVLFIAGKGDGNIRYYEIDDGASSCFALSEYRTAQSAKGVAFLPKRACNPMACEIARVLKLTSSSTVEPLKFIVPRKSESFQEDIFPDTRSGEPALTAEAWFGGETAEPKRMSMDPAKNGGKTSAAASFKPSGAGAGSGGPTFEGKNAAELFAELEAARARIAELELENASLKA